MPTYAEQVFVNDITYVDIDGQHGYLALVTDWFSKRIMGYKLDDNMRVSLTKDALEMAVKNRIYSHLNIIHHSDRGLQYCCPDYSEFAQKRGMILSTTQQYDPYEKRNVAPCSSRKNKWYHKVRIWLHKKLPSMEVAQKMIGQAIEIYNKERRHKSLNMRTPAQAHKENNHQHKFYKKIKSQKPET